MLNQKLQIILIIQCINAKAAKVIWYQEKNVTRNFWIGLKQTFKCKSLGKKAHFLTHFFQMHVVFNYVVIAKF